MNANMLGRSLGNAFHANSTTARVLPALDGENAVTGDSAQTSADPGSIVPTGEASTGGANSSVTPTLISAVYDPGRSSPLVDQPVVFEAIVTDERQDPDDLGGFFVHEEDANADRDPATLESIFVNAGEDVADVNVGDLVRVSGTVREFYDVPQLADVTSIEVLSSDNPLPLGETDTTTTDGQPMGGPQVPSEPGTTGPQTGGAPAKTPGGGTTGGAPTDGQQPGGGTAETPTGGETLPAGGSTIPEIPPGGGTTAETPTDEQPGGTIAETPTGSETPPAGGGMTPEIPPGGGTTVEAPTGGQPGGSTAETPAGGEQPGGEQPPAQPASHPVEGPGEWMIFNRAADVTGTSAPEMFQGSGEDDTIASGGGADWASGREGADRFDGGAGSDHLDGGAGADTLTGGAGVDMLTGGADADQFVFAVADASEGGDLVMDFDAVQGDKLAFAAADFGAAAGDAFPADRFVTQDAQGAFSGETRDATLVYNDHSGQLWFDANGTEAGGGLSYMATLLGAPAVTAQDVLLV